jgi:hypothetical protein
MEDQVANNVFRDRYLVVGVGALVVFFSCVSVALAYIHVTNSTAHGLTEIQSGMNYQPYGYTDPPGSAYATAEVRHYYDDGSYTVQCSDAGNGFADCAGTWGTAKCQKRYVGGADGWLARHWVRWESPPCTGQMHA